MTRQVCYNIINIFIRTETRESGFRTITHLPPCTPRQHKKPDFSKKKRFKVTV